MSMHYTQYHLVLPTILGIDNHHIPILHIGTLSLAEFSNHSKVIQLLSGRTRILKISRKSDSIDKEKDHYKDN